MPKSPGAARAFAFNLASQLSKPLRRGAVEYGSTQYRFYGSQSAGGANPYALTLDLYASFIIVVELSIFLFVGLYGPAVMITSTYIVVLTLAGLVLGLGTGTLKFSLRWPSETTRDKMLIYFGIAFVGVLLVNAFVNLIPVTLSVGGSVSSDQIITLEISAAEETWFRGFLGPFFANRLGKFPGLAAQGGLFSIYHVVTYGDNVSALLIVAGAGFVLGYVDIQTGSLFPSLAGHFANNLIALGVV